MTMDVLDSIAKLLGTPDEALARRRRMDRATRFALAHMEQWRSEHPDSWIAVHDERLLAAESSREQLLEAIESTHVSLTEVYVDFLRRDKAALFL